MPRRGNSQRSSQSQPVNKRRVGASARTIQTKNEALGFDSTLGMFEFLSNSLMQQAAEPNMHGYEPHPKQLEFHQAQETGRLFLGGNRSGKTAAGVIEDLWWVTKRHPYRRIPDTQIRGRVLGDGFENGTINEVLIPTFKRWILPSDMVNGSWEDSWSRQDRQLNLSNGSFLEFKSYDQDIQKHAGTSRHFIHFDEEPPQNIYIENLVRIIDTGGSWWMTMTPLNGMNWVYDDLFLLAEQGKLHGIKIFEVDMTDNPYLSLNIIEQLMQGVDESEKEQRVHGRFAERGGKIFPEFGPVHLLQSSPFMQNGIYNSPPDSWRVYCSFDFGLNNPTAVLWHAVSSDNRVITFAEHYASDMVIKDHSERVKEKESQLGIRNRVYLRAGDPAGKQRNQVTGTSIIQEYSESGIYISTDYIPRAVMVGINKMRTYLKLGPSLLDTQGNLKGPGYPHWQIVESECPNLVRELRRLHWKTYSSSKSNDLNNKLEEVHKKDDHAFDSARYFFTLLPDLAPEELWHSEAINITPHSYMDTLIEMERIKREGYNGEDNNGFGFDPRHTRLIGTTWMQASSGFAESEYGFDSPESYEDALG